MSRSMDFYLHELKGRPLMPALLSQMGIDIPPDKLIRVPAHIYPDTRPSTMIYNDHLTDYGDGNKRYDLLDVAKDWMGQSLDQAVALLAELAGLTPPEPYQGKIQPVRFAEGLPKFTKDPNDYALFATRAADSLSGPCTPEAIHAAEYLLSRELYAAAVHFNCGVADPNVNTKLPGGTWRNMITFPSWHSGQLLALKGRNTESGERRVMRNLSGAGTAPYGLHCLREGDGGVLVVEGETDTLSVWTAFEGDVSVIGIPGAGHWHKLKHPALEGRRLYLCLDMDKAGTDAMTKAQQWAADEGRKLTVIQGIGDKNAILMRDGERELRRLITGAVKQKRGRAVRALT